MIRYLKGIVKTFHASFKTIQTILETMSLKIHLMSDFFGYDELKDKVFKYLKSKA